MKKKLISAICIIILLIGLILIRKLEYLFYDPFLYYFKSEFHHKPLPNFDFLRLFASHFFRFSLNSTLSLAIIYCWFKDDSITKFSFVVYCIAFIFFSTIYFGMIYAKFPLGYMPFFYVRRFIIQPLLLLLLIPSIIFYKSEAKKRSRTIKNKKATF